MKKEEGKEKQEIAVVLNHTKEQTVIVKGTEEGPQAIEVLRPMQEGKPIHGDLVSLEQREDGFYNVTRTKLGTSSGPRQVATDKYRENFDKIFDKKNLN